MKKFFHKLLSIFLSIAFLGLTVSCEKTVTKYNSEGTPYTTEEFSAWETIGVLILLMMALGAIAASSSKSKDGSFLNKGNILYASAEDGSIISDAMPDKKMNSRWIELVDKHGNLISRHLIQLDALQSGRNIINLSETQLSVEVNKQVLKKLIDDMAKSNNLTSIPDAISADISFSADEPGVLTINSVDVLSDANPKDGDSVLIVDSGQGIFRTVTRVLKNTNSQPAELTRLSIVVDPVN